MKFKKEGIKRAIIVPNAKNVSLVVFYSNLKTLGLTIKDYEEFVKKGKKK